MKGKVYTSLDKFKYGSKTAKPYTELNKELVEWIEETTEELLKKRNKAELNAGAELLILIPNIEKQVFFRIHGRCYFLDYYYPAKRIAIEIDGGYHKGRVKIDRQRDKDFSEIGIATIRISDKDVLNGNLLSVLEKKQKKININRSKKKKVKKEVKKNRLIDSAMRRLKEHDRMKHNARWI